MLNSHSQGQAHILQTYQLLKEVYKDYFNDIKSIKDNISEINKM